MKTSTQPTQHQYFVGFCLLILLSSWLVNLYKLTQCDFASPYKAEVTHAAGLIPGVSLLTMWHDSK